MDSDLTSDPLIPTGGGGGGGTRITPDPKQLFSGPLPPHYLTPLSPTTLDPFSASLAVLHHFLISTKSELIATPEPEAEDVHPGSAPAGGTGQQGEYCLAFHSVFYFFSGAFFFLTESSLTSAQGNHIITLRGKLECRLGCVGGFP